jgi:hypothetical protein
MNQLWKEVLRETSISTQFELLDIVSKYKSSHDETNDTSKAWIEVICWWMEMD